MVRSDNTSAATTNCAAAAAGAERQLRRPWTTTASAPPASIPARAMKTASPGLKDAIDQALILRGSRDFDTGDYASFVRQMVERRNRLVEGKLEQELLCLAPCPQPRWEYVNYQSKVRKWCTIQVAGLQRALPSHRQGGAIRLYADWAEVYYQGHLVERMERVRGEGEANVNYRHACWCASRRPLPFQSSCFPPCTSG